MAYPPPYYAETDLPTLWQRMRRYPFALLTLAREGRVEATHLPILLRTPNEGGAAPYGTLEGHVAINNPSAGLIRQGAEALVVFGGPHAYISPAWYVDSRTVPTWNYLAVKARGTLRPLPAEQLMPHLEWMVSTMEAASPQPWTMEEGVAPGYAEKLAHGIVGFRLDLAELSGVSKLNQNKTQRDIRSVVQHLRARGGADDLAVAAEMESLLTQPSAEEA